MAHNMHAAPLHSQSCVDVWTCVHYLYGVHFSAVCRLSWRATCAVGLAWELAENTKMGIELWQSTGEAAYYGDSLRNSAVDMAALMFGWHVASLCRRK